MLPLSREEMVEAFVSLPSDQDDAARAAVSETLKTLDPWNTVGIASDEKSSPAALGFLLLWKSSPRELLGAVIFNRSTPDQALAHLAGAVR